MCGAQQDTQSLAFQSTSPFSVRDESKNRLVRQFLSKKLVLAVIADGFLCDETEIFSSKKSYRLKRLSIKNPYRRRLI